MGTNEAFLSFAEYMEDSLSGSGLSFGIAIDENLNVPYARLERGAEIPKGNWLVTLICQVRFVVARETTRYIEDTGGYYRKLITDAIRNAGSIPKYDYRQTPKKQIGLVNVEIGPTSGNVSKDRERYQEAVTVRIHTNA